MVAGEKLAAVRRLQDLAQTTTSGDVGGPFLYGTNEQNRWSFYSAASATALLCRYALTRCGTLQLFRRTIGLFSNGGVPGQDDMVMRTSILYKHSDEIVFTARS